MPYSLLVLGVVSSEMAASVLGDGVVEEEEVVVVVAGVPWLAPTPATSGRDGSWPIAHGTQPHKTARCKITAPIVGATRLACSCMK